MIRPDWYYLVHDRTRVAIVIACFGGAMTTIAAMSAEGLISLGIIIVGFLLSAYSAIWIAPSGRTVAIQWEEYEDLSENA